MNKMIRVLHIIILVSFCSCTSSKVTITKFNHENFVKDTLNYSTFWTAMRCGFPENAEIYTNNFEYLKFSKALQNIKNYEFNKAEILFNDLIANTKNDTILDNSRVILEQILIYQGKWQDYYEKYRRKETSDSIERIRLLYPVFIGNKELITNDNTIDTISFKIKKGLIFIPVNINGFETEFLFDTGSQFSLLSDEILDYCKINPLSNNQNALLSSNNTTSNIKTAIIEKMKLGNIKIENKPCFITESANLKFNFLFYTFLEFKGIIGWDLIKKFDITIDYKTNKMYIKTPEKLNNFKRNLFWLNQPIVKVKTTNGIDLMFYFDSGAQESRYYDILTKKLNLEGLKSQSENIYGIGGNKKQEINIIPKISFLINDKQLEFNKIKSGISNEDHFFVLDGVFGNDIGLSSEKLHIDAENGIFELFVYEE